MSHGPDLADHPARILIVDDERHNRELLEVMLSDDYLLLTAASGEEALAIVAEQSPDIVLLDVMMPGMNGYQVAATIKGNPATKNIPVIIITALDDRNAKMVGLGSGAEEFLTKPVDRAELCVRVRNLLRLKAYGDYHDKYSQLLEGEVSSRTAALRHERDRAQRYLDTATVMLLALDVEGRITAANRYACAVLGWTEAELLGRDWLDTCLVAREREHVRTRSGNLLRGDGSIVENTICTKSGDERVIEWRTTVVRDGAGEITGTFSSGTDVTERNRAVDGIRTAEERTRFALKNANVGIWDIDFAAGVLRWSEALESQYGFHPGTFGGTLEAFIERVHPDDRTKVLRAIAEASKSGADFSVQNRSIRPDGTIRWLVGTGRFVLGEDGKPLRGVGISQDITQQRLLEAQVRQSNKMDAVGQLAAGVAHDFNNLLTIVLGFAEFVAADPVTASTHGEELGEIVKAAKRAAGLTSQLLAFSRQQVLQPVDLDLNLLITDMTAMLSRLIGVNIEVSLALAPNLCLAFADRGQIEQVVMNLVVNARDAMPEGGRVTIETSVVTLENSAFHPEAITPGTYVMIAITDTGGGMTKDTQLRLFEPFFTTKEIGKGTGLGLSTSYGIIKQSQGHIRVYSELGRGTTFKVYLPCSEAIAPSPTLASAAGAPAKRSLRTVLLVEDEAGLRQLAKRILNRAGHRVLEASNADDAERVFVENPDSIDLVVTDVIMPGRGGAELVRRLQVHAPALKVLYMSGYTERSALSREAGDDGGDLRFIQKPFTSAEFARHVREALDG